VGLNGQWGATYPVYLTASHCSNRSYGLDQGTTWFFQAATPQFAQNRVGWEWADPTAAQGSACPSGTYCRWSDVLAVRYKHDSLTAGPSIARPDGSPGYGSPGGSSTITGSFYVLGSFPYSIVGEELQKVGRTTAWTRGYVTATCVAKDSGVIFPGTSSQIWILCNDVSSIWSDYGDSGSPIFKWYGDGNAYFAGILWGGPSNNPSITYHSPLTSIVRDMGLYTFYTF
jgi:hypothetical protein